MIEYIIIAALALVAYAACVFACACRQDAKWAERDARDAKASVVMYQRLARNDALILTLKDAEIAKLHRELERSEQRIYGVLFRN